MTHPFIGLQILNTVNVSLEISFFCPLGMVWSYLKDKIWMWASYILEKMSSKGCFRSPDHPHFPSPVGPFPVPITRFLFLPLPYHSEQPEWENMDTSPEKTLPVVLESVDCLSFYFQSWLHGFLRPILVGGAVCSRLLPLPPSVPVVASGSWCSSLSGSLELFASWYKVAWVVMSSPLERLPFRTHFQCRMKTLSCWGVGSSCEWWIFLQKGPFTWDFIHPPLWLTLNG